MNLIDSLQNSLGLSSTTEVETNSSVSTSTAGLDQAFGSLLSLMQDSENTSSDAESSGISATIDSMQKNLVTAIGLDQFAGDALSQLSSLSSITNLQTSLLSNLNASLFSAAIPSGETDVSATDLSETATDRTFLSSVEDFSNYIVGDDGLGVDDLFDTVNILNHIPVVSDIYQSTSEIDVDPVAEIIGGYAYGGPIGVAFAAADMALESYTGKSIYHTVADFFFEDTEKASIESTVSQVTDSIDQANKAYNFVTRSY
ncbi:hypothetical protein Q4574_15035 [Aliiglaciecola sp. 3_MG-2023]|uniref:hypothetical protein n=1 Tax=Aliiglaciecola sp. 3_MG-2023 TaxID=3062644 RepID=UPI0026E17EB6|nr:hypothetical protein [Aliiglaciecola sp. 3_MG-2023]MDO6694609.1 hypothetical protein [Aliiglaciecola sp. 3_MG-2023]